MFYSLHPLRGRNVFALLVSCLCMALVFAGCAPEPDDFVDDHLLNEKLIGTWTDNLAGDSYTITADHLSYGYGGGVISYAGAIKSVSNFTRNAGVIIIEYDPDHKASYWEYDADWNPVTELPLKGDFIGIYFKTLKSGSVQIGGAYEDGGAEKATLDEAKEAFTIGYADTYMTYYGAYTK